MFSIAYTLKRQVHAGWVKIVSHSSSRTSAISKYFCSNLPTSSLDIVHTSKCHTNRISTKTVCTLPPLLLGGHKQSSNGNRISTKTVCPLPPLLLGGHKQSSNGNRFKDSSKNWAFTWTSSTAFIQWWNTFYDGTSQGAQWLSGKVLDSRPRGHGFKPHRCHCVEVLEQDTFILA